MRLLSIWRGVMRHARALEPASAPARPALSLSGEIEMPDGETVPVPEALLAAVQDAVLTKTIAGNPGLERGRTAFVGRFLRALYGRQLLLVERGRPGKQEMIGIDAYSLICSQKHDLQRRLQRVGHRALAPGVGGRDLAEQLESLFAELTGHAPPGVASSTRARCADAVFRVRGIIAAVTGDDPTIDPDKVTEAPTVTAAA